MLEGNIVGTVEKWGNGRRLLHRQPGGQLVVTGHGLSPWAGTIRCWYAWVLYNTLHELWNKCV